MRFSKCFLLFCLFFCIPSGSAHSWSPKGPKKYILGNVNSPGTQSSRQVPRQGYTVTPPPQSRLSNKSERVPSKIAVFAADSEDKTDSQDNERTISDLHDRDSRVGFIRKVYGILSCQLMVTAAIVMYFNTSKDLLNFMYGPNGQYLMWFSLASSFVPILILTFSETLRHSFPLNLGMMAWFTLGESVLIGMFTTFFKTKSVLLAMVQTAVATLGLTLYSFQPNPKYDLTGHGQALFSGLFIFLMFGIINIFIKSSAAELLRSAGGAFLFSLFIIYDTQMIVGGKKKKFQYDSKEYLLAALNLYMDIVNLFIYLLRLFGESE